MNVVRIRRWWFSWRSQCAGAHLPLTNPPTGCLDTGEASRRRVQGVACVGAGHRRTAAERISCQHLRRGASSRRYIIPSRQVLAGLYSTAWSWVSTVVIRILANAALSKSMSATKLIIFSALFDRSSSLRACCSTCASCSCYYSAGDLDNQTTVRVNSIFSIYNYV